MQARDGESVSATGGEGKLDVLPFSKSTPPPPPPFTLPPSLPPVQRAAACCQKISKPSHAACHARTPGTYAWSSSTSWARVCARAGLGTRTRTRVQRGERIRVGRLPNLEIPAHL